MSPDAPDVVSLFTELAALPSPPGEERVVADRVTAYLRELGLEVTEDDAGSRIGSNAGNLYARIDPTDQGGTPLFFCAHLDTVPPDGALEPVVEAGVVRNPPGTIFGADNKAAVPVIVQVARPVLLQGRPPGRAQVLLPAHEQEALHG